MGNMTNDMTRLRGEVDGLRVAMAALMHDLAQGAKNLASEVSAMRADFAGAREAMVKAHAAMAKKTRKGREAFVSGMRKRVNRMRREFSSDLAGARSAWCGR